MHKIEVHQEYKNVICKGINSPFFTRADQFVQSLLEKKIEIITYGGFGAWNMLEAYVQGFYAGKTDLYTFKNKSAFKSFVLYLADLFAYHEIKLIFFKKIND